MKSCTSGARVAPLAGLSEAIWATLCATQGDSIGPAVAGSVKNTLQIGMGTAGLEPTTSRVCSEGDCTTKEVDLQDY